MKIKTNKNKVNKENKDKIYNKYIKRFFDIIISIVGLILSIIPIIIFSIWIKLDSKGPVFFKQRRIGRNNKAFDVYKLRTMDTKLYNDEGEELRDVERLTKPGKFARATSVDELPQFWNILKGDMSLIGPRPMPISYFPFFTEEEMKRHNVRPGITGLAQVNGRAFLEWNRRFAYDKEYSENISFKLDIKIFFKTIAKVIKKEGTSLNQRASIGAFNSTRNFVRGNNQVLYDKKGNVIDLENFLNDKG